MAEGRTLWDRLTGANKPVLNEQKHWNPFKVRIGCTLHIDMLDYREAFYTVGSLEILDRGLGRALMADYRLVGKLASKPESLILRTVPREGKGGSSKLDFRIIALNLFFECGWDDEARPGIMEGVNDKDGEFAINAGSPDERKYWRMHGLKGPEKATVKILEDDNGNGVVEDSEIKTRRIEQWAFSRTTIDEANQEVDEYLYVEKDTNTGWLQILIGREIPPERIIV